jgi:GNAT superfamily N-acetyltransferase
VSDPSRYRLERVQDTSRDLAWLDAECFPEDAPYPKLGADWWAIRCTGAGLVAFGGLRYWPADHAGFLCRSGVLRDHRGQGLQRRLIRARVRHAQKAGWRGVYTYTAPWNCASANNLITEGFRTFEPVSRTRWGGEGMVYWWLGF